MCYSQFFGKKYKDQTLVSCTKKIAYFWFPQGMIIFPGGERLKWNFRRGGGGGGVIRKIPSVGGGGGGYGYFLEPHIFHGTSFQALCLS